MLVCEKTVVSTEIAMFVIVRAIAGLALLSDSSVS